MKDKLDFLKTKGKVSIFKNSKGWWKGRLSIKQENFNIDIDSVLVLSIEICIESLYSKYKLAEKELGELL